MPHRVDEGLATTLKRVASVLKQAEIPFALGGSFAVYAHGGHSSDHDVDFLIREQDEDRALEELAAAGFSVEQPPEDWLVKVYDERPAGGPDLPAGRERRSPTRRCADTRDPPGRRDPHAGAVGDRADGAQAAELHPALLRLRPGLPLARSLREQIDWDRVRRETAQSPYAEAFLVLLDRLDVVPLPGEHPDHRRGMR